MKSTFKYLLCALVIIFFSHNGSSQESPEPDTLNPIHIKGHLGQGTSYIYNFQKEGGPNFGCFDPSLPFHLTLIFDNYNEFEGDLIVILNEEGERLANTIVKSQLTNDTSTHPDELSTTINFLPLNGLSCDDPNPTITILISSSHDLNEGDHNEIIEINLNLCCESFKSNEDSKKEATVIGIEDLGHPIIFNQKIKSKSNFNEIEKCQIIIIDNSGNVIKSTTVNQTSYVDISSIPGQGIYHIIVVSKNGKMKFQRKILVLE